jgi:hypothetical protein
VTETFNLFDEVPPPIFILAAPRSFTSLVTAMIGQHPELYGVPELNLFQCETLRDFNAGPSVEGGLKSPFWAAMRHGLLRTVAQIYGGEQTVESIRMAERWVRLRESMTSGEAFREICRAVAPRRVVEKSPGVLRKQEYLLRMLEAFPAAKFIHLVRHPRAQCQSVLKTKGGIGVLLALNSVDHHGPKAALEPQIVWHDTQIQILRFLDELPDSQFVTIRAEEFMTNLNEVLPALCRWLGVSDAPDALAAMRHPEASPFSSEGPVNARLGNDINFLRSPALREGEVRMPELDGPLPWRKDGADFHPDVKALAHALGY